MSVFKIGDKVTCIKQGFWKSLEADTPPISGGPKAGDKLIIKWINKGDYLFFEEHPRQLFDSSEFVPYNIAENPYFYKCF